LLDADRADALQLGWERYECRPCRSVPNSGRLPVWFGCAFQLSFSNVCCLSSSSDSRCRFSSLWFSYPLSPFLLDPSFYSYAVGLALSFVPCSRTSAARI